MKGYPVFLLLLLMTPLCLLAQEPPETEIELPPILLETRALDPELIEAALPGQLRFELPTLTLALPELELYRPEPRNLELRLPEGSVPDPEIPESPLGSIYSQGTLGVGSMGHLFGALSLFKLGEDPRSRLDFFHESHDGYWLGSGGSFASPGTYFSDRVSRISGEVQFQQEQWISEVTMGFEERESGFQQKGAYPTVLNRFLYLDYGGAFLLGSRGGFDLQGRFGNVSQILTGTAAQLEEELSWDILGGAFYQWERLALEGRGFFGQVFLGNAMRFATGLELNLAWRPLEALEAQFHFRPSWSGADRFLWPLGLVVNYSQQGLRLSLAAGRENELVSQGELWAQDGRLRGGQNPYLVRDGWSGRLEAVLFPEGPLGFRLDLPYHFWSNREQMVAPLLAAEGLGRYYDTGLLELQEIQGWTFAPQLGLSWEFVQDFVLDLSARGYWGLDDPQEPDYRFQWKMAYGEERNLGLALEGLWSLNEVPEVPLVDLRTFWKLVEGLRLRLDVLDIFSLFLDEGRQTPLGYQDRGFRAGFYAEIAL